MAIVGIGSIDGMAHDVDKFCVRKYFSDQGRSIERVGPTSIGGGCIAAQLPLLCRSKDRPVPVQPSFVDVLSAEILWFFSARNEDLRVLNKIVKQCTGARFCCSNDHEIGKAAEFIFLLVHGHKAYQQFTTERQELILD